MRTIRATVRSLRTVMRSLSLTIPLTIVVTDCLAYIAKVDGVSMQPTFNEDLVNNCSDFVLLSHWSSRKYDIKRGQIVSIISPRDPNQLIIKRVIALEGDTVVTRHNCKHRNVVVPKGHVWVEGDNHEKSMDSNSFGPVALGLISAISLYIVWPPNRSKKLDISMPSDRTIIIYPNENRLIAINYQDLSYDENISLVEPN